MAQCLAKILVVVIAGEREDRSAVAQKGEERLLYVANGFAQTVGASQFAEQVAGNEHHVHLVLSASGTDTFDGPAQVVGPVNASEPIAEMPVRRVQDFHAVVRQKGRVRQIAISNVADVNP
jgi:hypothetical protein